MPAILIPERPDHAGEIERVLDRAFGPGRFAKTSERVRERGARHRRDLSRVAALDARVIGVCRLYEARAGAPLLFLGPLAVDPGDQHKGLGAALVHACLEAARADGARAIACVGAAAFFEPLGFSIIPHGVLTLPGPVNPDRFLWAALNPPGVSGLGGMIGPP